MITSTTYRSVPDTMYSYDAQIEPDLNELQQTVAELRGVGVLSGETLRHLRRFFRIKNIYHSNAIEGNLLDYGETRLVVEEGLTITGKPLKDTLEAKNLADALDLFEKLADREGEPIRGVDVRSLHAAILKGIDEQNAGKYRTTAVEISGSAFKPPSPEKVPSMMDDFLRWLETCSTPSKGTEPESPVVCACAAHAWLAYVHPFVDGNGRAARLLMNLILMRYGYPIAIISRDDRHRYYDALEESQASDLTPFIGLVTESIRESLEEYQRAAQEQRSHVEWARSIVSALSEKEVARARNEYEVWRSAMDLLKSFSKQTVDALREQAADAGLVQLYLKDFGILEFEKYLSLRNGGSAKKTWFFRVDFRSGERAARYLFFFGYASARLGQETGGKTVTLHIARETTPFHYEKLTNLTSSNTPDAVEVGYLPEQEKFVWLNKAGRVEMDRVEEFVRKFVEQVSKREF